MLVENGADSVKVGIGPGSICTTRVVAGVGVPQLSAVYDVYSALKGTDVPLIADGGLRYSGDIVKALAAGGSCVMIGSLVAGTEEIPATPLFTTDVSSRAIAAWARSRRWSRSTVRGPLFPGRHEGSEEAGARGHRRSCALQGNGAGGDLPDDWWTSLGHGLLRRFNHRALHEARFVRITNAGVMESHPHDITITSEAPNYSRPND